MELKDFIAIRRAYNVVRLSYAPSARITFEELALLAYLSRSKVATGVKTSDLAAYQHVLRPTMTHRTTHLATAGYIQRMPGVQDHRNICCFLRPEGKKFLESLENDLLVQLALDQVLVVDTNDDVRDYVIAVGRMSVTASCMVQLALAEAGGRMDSMSELVYKLGLVQPTVSMAVSALVEEGKITRDKPGSVPQRSNPLTLSAYGREKLEPVYSTINDLNINASRGIYG